MNSVTRSKILAAKERLQRLNEETREAEQRKAAQIHWEKTQEEERVQEAAKMKYHQNQTKYLAEKEKLRVEEKSKEEEQHLRQHNKKVRQVLSQVAKASGQGNEGDEVADEDNVEEETSSTESDGVEEQGPDHQTRSQGESLNAATQNSGVETGRMDVDRRGSGE